MYVVIILVYYTSYIFLKNKYKEKYISDMKGHYEDSGIDKKTMHAMKARKLASDVSILNIFKILSCIDRES